MSMDKNLKMRFDLYFQRYQEVNKLALEHLSQSKKWSVAHKRFRITDANIFNSCLKKDELPIFAALLYSTNLVSQVADFFIQEGRLHFNGEKKEETYPEIMGILSEAYLHICPSTMPLFILESIDPTEQYWNSFKCRQAWQSNKDLFDASVEWCIFHIDDLLDILSPSSVYKESKHEVILLLEKEHSKISERINNLIYYK